MSPKKLPTRPGDKNQARRRREISQKYLEVAELVDSEDGTAINVCVGLAVLAGIAASDAICLAAIGERYSGSDHAAAADLLKQVDHDLGNRLAGLVSLKPASHYGDSLLKAEQRDRALRSAKTLVEDATHRTT